MLLTVISGEPLLSTTVSPLSIPMTITVIIYIHNITPFTHTLLYIIANYLVNQYTKILYQF